MSEKIAAAAAAMGLPETLVERSAAARAAEIGASADDVLTEWAGGEAAPVTAAPATDPTDTGVAATPEPADPEPAPAPEPMISEAGPQELPVEAAASGPFVPPVLVGAKDNPMTVLAGVIGLFIIVVMVGLVGPSIPIDDAGARTSEVNFSSSAEHGQDLYSSLGCAACHTQMVRPVVADVGLGPVTLNDTNQVLGTRRFGPDLSDIGGRMTSSQIEATVEGLGDHPAHSLSADDMTDLVSYLSESAPEGGS